MLGFDHLLICSYEKGVCCGIDLTEAMGVQFHPVLFEVKELNFGDFDCYLKLKLHQPIVENRGISLAGMKHFAYNQCDNR